MDKFSTRSVLIAIVATFVGGILVFLFQEVWRDRVNLVVEVAPNSLFNLADIELPSYHLEAIERYQKSDGIFLHEPDNIDVKYFRKSLDVVVSNEIARARLDGQQCAYEITVYNNGTLPAEDVFVQIGGVGFYSETDSSGGFSSKQIQNSRNNMIMAGQLKQGTSTKFVAYANYGCLFGSDRIVAGHRFGSAKLRYMRIPWQLPTWFVDYPSIALFVVLGAALIVALFAFALVVEVLKSAGIKKAEVDPKPTT